MSNASVYETLVNPMLAAGIIVYVTNLLKQAFPGFFSRERLPVFTMVFGMMLEMGAWGLGFLPGLPWREALLLGVYSGLAANGVYSGLKAQLGKRVQDTEKPEKPVEEPETGYKPVAFYMPYSVPRGETFLEYPREVVKSIIEWADQNGLPPVNQLATALQESGGKLNPYAMGDWDGRQYTSFGIYQIHTPVHGGPPEKWMGVDGLWRSMEQMRSRWQQTFHDCGGWDAIIDDIVDFQMRWAPRAQGSIEWSRQLAARRIGEALRIYILWLKDSQEAAPAPAPVNGLEEKYKAAMVDMNLTLDGIGDVLYHLEEVGKGLENAVKKQEA